MTRLRVRGVAGSVTDRVIIVPAKRADDIAGEAVEMTAYKDFIIEHVRAGQKTFGPYPLMDATNLEASRLAEQNGR